MTLLHMTSENNLGKGQKHWLFNTPSYVFASHFKSKIYKWQKLDPNQI